MKQWVKYVCVVAGIVCGLAVTTAIVRAASAGEDFSWLSTSEGGIRIGTPGAEGEDTPEPNTLEFFPGPEGEPGVNKVVFSGNAVLQGTETISTVVYGYSEGEGSAYEMQSGVMASTGAVLGTLSAGGGDAGGRCGHCHGASRGRRRDVRAACGGFVYGRRGRDRAAWRTGGRRRRRRRARIGRRREFFERARAGAGAARARQVYGGPLPHRRSGAAVVLSVQETKQRGGCFHE